MDVVYYPQCCESKRTAGGGIGASRSWPRVSTRSYLSGRAELSTGLVEALEERRSAAAEADAPAPLMVAGEEFGVEPRSLGNYRYRLMHHTGLVGVTASERLPALRVQPRSEFLHAVGPVEVLRFFEASGSIWRAGRCTGACLDWTCSATCRAGRCTATTGTGSCVEAQVERLTRTARPSPVSSSAGVPARRCARGSTTSRTRWNGRASTGGRRCGATATTNPGRCYASSSRSDGRDWVSIGVDSPSQGLEAASRLWASVTDDWLSYRTPTADGTKSTLAAGAGMGRRYGMRRCDRMPSAWTGCGQGGDRVSFAG